MSAAIIHPIQGISHLIIEESARDAHVQGVPDSTEVSIVTLAGEQPAPEEYVTEGPELHFRGAPALRVLVPMDLPVTIMRAGGDLRLHDLAGDVRVEVAYGDLRVQEIAGTVRLGHVNGSLRAEAINDLRLQGKCDGDVRFQDGDNFEAHTIAGDLRLQGVATARIEHLRGDLWAEKMRGPLYVDKADGDARLSEIAGMTTLRVLRGNLRGVCLAGGLDAPSVNGDVAIEGPYASEQDYVLRAAGDASLQIPPDADLRLVVRAKGRIRSDIQLTPSPDGSPVFTCLLGRGNGHLEISCDGDLKIRQSGSESTVQSTAGGLSDLGDRIRQQVAASLASAGINIDTGEINWAQMGIGRPARGGKESRSLAPSRSPASERSRQATEPQQPSTEEQMAILRMVEAGTITAEEAEMLLKALGA